MNRSRIIGLVAATGLALAACGSSDPAATTDPATSGPGPTAAVSATDAPPASDTPTTEAAPTEPAATQDPVVEPAAETDTPATDPPATDSPVGEAAPAPAPVGGRTFAATVEAAAQFEGNPFPDLVVDDVGRGAEANLANILPADRPVLLWAWAPH